jgi:hypothetical protein
MSSETKYRLAVDTDQYAGSFERQSIAFATGLIGECGVGMGQQKEAEEEMSEEQRTWWDMHVIQNVDEHGVSRPAFIYPTPGMFNNGIGGCFPITDEGRVQGLAAYKEANGKYHGDHLKRTDFIVPGQNGWTAENIESERERLRKEIEKSANATTVSEYPAYMSVAVEVDEMPSDEILASFSERMKQYLEDKKVTVLSVAVETEVIERKITRSRAP